MSEISISGELSLFLNRDGGRAVRSPPYDISAIFHPSLSESLNKEEFGGLFFWLKGTESQCVQSSVQVTDTCMNTEGLHSVCLSHPLCHTCWFSQNLCGSWRHMARVPRSGKAAFFFRDLLCVPALFFPLFCIFPAEILMYDQSWEDLRPMTVGTKGAFVTDLHPVGKGEGGRGTMDGDYEIMLGWRSRLQKSCQSLLLFFFSLSPSTVLLFVWAIISFSQNPPQMKWPFISKRPKTELMLLTGDCFRRSLSVTLRCTEEPSHTRTPLETNEGPAQAGYKVLLFVWSRSAVLHQPGSEGPRSLSQLAAGWSWSRAVSPQLSVGHLISGTPQRHLVQHLFATAYKCRCQLWLND